MWAQVAAMMAEQKQSKQHSKEQIIIYGKIEYKGLN
jgi:hypothetical protein